MDLIRNSGLDPVADCLLVQLEMVSQLADREELPLGHARRLAPSPTPGAHCGHRIGIDPVTHRLAPDPVPSHDFVDRQALLHVVT